MANPLIPSIVEGIVTTGPLEDNYTKSYTAQEGGQTINVELDSIALSGIETASANTTVTFTSSSGTSGTATTDSNGYYSFDLANIGVSSGETFTLNIDTRTATTETQEMVHRGANAQKSILLDEDGIPYKRDYPIPVGVKNIPSVRFRGLDPDGHFHFVGITHDGALNISDQSNGLAIAQGKVTDSTFIHKFGETPDFDTGDNAVTIWDGADDGGINEMTYNYSTTAAIDTISSSNAGDTEPIEIQGLDGNHALVTQTATLNGQNQVTLSTALLRVFRLKNEGTSDLAGNVYCFEQTADAGGDGIPDDTSKVRAVIRNGNNQTLMAIYTIPAGKTGYMRSWFAALAGGSRTSNYVITLWARKNGGVFQLKHKAALAEGGTSNIQHKYVEPEVFTEKTDIEMRAQITEASITAANITGGFDIVLVDN